MKPKQSKKGNEVVEMITMNAESNMDKILDDGKRVSIILVYSIVVGALAFAIAFQAIMEHC